ncbi:NAD(P)H-dependent oxidoreductase subunit E [Myxococcota bacterium]|nr:NAD(P)H-dependent oxidoreductase subunit E [Myxococcota bacterium]MBU1380330.1 NAD(P)H-dependent oxidoreductase subunit E [Myxococcota bacterium]MBU1496336.1 NAD(P)H-dependent oxidoreductase subunit E [Myxococcota bacterium]
MSVLATVKTVIDTEGTARHNLLPVLTSLRSKLGSLSPEILKNVSQIMDIPMAHVYGTATFYSFLETKPMGKNVIRLCRTISCDMHGKRDVLNALEDVLAVKNGETTTDGLFTLTETNCLGHCHEGPVMLVNDEVFSSLKPENIPAIIDEIRKKR